MILPDDVRISLAGPDDGKQVRALWEEAFPEDAPAFVAWYFTHVYRPEHTLGAYAGAEGLAFLQCNPYTLSLLGRPVPAAAVAGVSTWPQHRHRGYARRLLIESMSLMRQMGCAASFLYPFSHGFYRPFGYETAMNMRELGLARPAGVSSAGELQDGPGAAALLPIYRAFAAYYPVMAVRDGAAMERALAQQESDGGLGALYVRDGQPRGYVFYHLDDATLTLDEWALIDRGDLDDMLHALFARRPRARLLQGRAPADMDGYSRYAASAALAPYVMMRIIDIAAFLRGGCVSGVPEASVAFTDSLCAWNCRTLRVGSRGGRLLAEETPGPADFTLDVTILPRFLWGMEHPDTLVAAGAVAGDTRRFRNWARALFQPTAFLWENF